MAKKVICIDKNNKKYPVSVDKLAFRPSVYAVIIKDGKILLSKQWDGYDFPGGGIDLGEDIKDALKREVKEETGLDVEVGKAVTVENSFWKPIIGEDVKDLYWHSILIYFLCDVVGGELSLGNIAETEKSYIDLPEWISLTETKNIKFYNSVDSLEIIKKALEIIKNQ